jgi:hypothetical protein
LRLRWYVKASGRALLRHWQWLVLAALFIPGLPILSLLALSGQLVSAMVMPGGPFLAHLGGLAGLHAIAILWILPQRQNLRGGAFTNFASTLPTSPHLRRAVDLTVLALADLLLLIPAAIALVLQARSPGAAAIFQSGAVIAAVATLFTVQTAIVGRQPRLLLAGATADVLLSLSLVLPLGVTAWLLLLLSFAAAITVLSRPEPARPLRHRAARDRISRPSRHLDRLPLFFRIQAKALAAHPLATVLRLGLVLVLAIATDALLVAFDFDARALPTAIASLAIGAVTLAGFYRTLRHAHVSMDEFLITLPIKPSFWPWRDTLFAIVLGLIPFGLLLVPLAFHGLASAYALTVLGLAYGSLIAGLRIPLRHDGGLNVILAVLIAASWASAAIAAVR